MEIRKALHEKPRLTFAASAMVVIGVLAFALYRSVASDAAPGSDRAGTVFFTDDDGATWFADSAAKVAPFEHNGRQAVRCFLFTCDGGETKFVGYLQRYTAESKKRREDMIAGKSLGAVSPAKPLEIEVKRPGDATWLRSGDPRAAQITEPRPRTGSAGVPVPVESD